MTTAENYEILIDANESEVFRAEREAVAVEYAASGRLCALEFADGSVLCLTEKNGGQS